ncbi:junctional adhesion molecule 2A-like isoform X4 [Portunus trituberculatus]|uniref:junctional adhesion molecule 2A-like isoform X4 n=1 Tax=Portunus trituberculatus TaxID=210409 RepID=UPI001E1CF288|nr:junctional adhesion molecule 2A-like isoform X4 [Portunus trituberculatus]
MLRRGTRLGIPHFLLLLLLGAATGCLGLRVDRVEVPPMVVEGGEAQLECEYDVEGEQLYSVKWYKDDKEFFRFIPADTPSIQVFRLPGVNVDKSRSTNSRVVLHRVSLRSSGKYRCEVSAEAPLFNTDAGGGRLLVVYAPRSDPSISGVHRRYAVGATVRANCTASPSQPTAALTWLVNGREAEASSLLHYPPTITTEGLYTAILGLHFRTVPAHFRYGELRLRCVATVAAGHQRHTTVYVRHGQTPSHPNCGLTDSCDGTMGSVAVMVMSLLV